VATQAPARTPPYALPLALLAYVGVAFALEPLGGRGGELLLGVTTWLALVVALRPAPRGERAQVAAVVLIATGGEILGSIVLGLYSYRRGGIPAFVPPGHGLIYLAGHRLSQSPFVRAHSRGVVRLAALAGSAWALLELGAAAHPDVVGALAMLALLAFLARGREPALFACMLLVVAILELYGTRMGTWQWSSHWPGLSLGMANPPSGVAAGYCAFDALALVLSGGALTRPGRSGRTWVRTCSSARATSLRSSGERCSVKCRRMPSRCATRADRSAFLPVGVRKTSTTRRSWRGRSRRTSPSSSMRSMTRVSPLLLWRM
jgi:hypothetical protein